MRTNIDRAGRARRAPHHASLLRQFVRLCFTVGLAVIVGDLLTVIAVIHGIITTQVAVTAAVTLNGWVTLASAFPLWLLLLRECGWEPSDGAAHGLRLAPLIRLHMTASGGVMLGGVSNFALLMTHHIDGQVASPIAITLGAMAALVASVPIWVQVHVMSSSEVKPGT